MRQSLSIVPLLVALAMLATIAPAAARSQVAIEIADPAGKDLSVLQVHTDAIERTPALWALWSDWGSRGGQAACEPGKGNCAFPKDTVIELHGMGIDPVVWWQPTDPQNWSLGRFERYVKIKNGHHDEYIRQWARDAKAAALVHGRPIVVRFAHEATGDWFPWSIGLFDNTRYNYKKAWRHIHQIFKSVGARKHVRFLWSNVSPSAKAYPGDAYVDYVGITVLNFGAQRTWKSMASMVDTRVKRTKRFTKKPIILAEVASHYKGGSKASWIKNGYLKAYNRHPKVKAIMYLDTDVPHLAGNQPDWRLVKPDDGSALAAYKAIAAKHKFKGQIK